LLVLSCIASLWVSGCSGDASSTAGPTPSVPTSSAPTSTPTPERETPEEFVRRWVEVDRKMQNTGDTAEYRQISALCRPCLEVAEQVEGYFKAGGYVKTDGWTIEALSATRRGRSASVRIDVDSARTTYVVAQGEDEKELAGGRGSYLLSLRARESSWVLADLVAVPA
jgi:hypothetical protein